MTIQSIFFRQNRFLRTGHSVVHPNSTVFGTNASIVGSFDKFLELFTADYVDCFSQKNTRTAHISTFFQSETLSSLAHVLVIVHLMRRFFDLNHFSENSFFYFTVDNPTLHFNYKRRNFFPFLFSSTRNVLLFSSLGLFSKMFLKPKSFIRNKAVYLLTSSFLRKVLIYSGIKHFEFYISRKPSYLQECIRLLFTSAIAPYKHPFSNDLVLERFHTNPF